MDEWYRPETYQGECGAVHEVGDACILCKGMDKAERKQRDESIDRKRGQTPDGGGDDAG